MGAPGQLTSGISQNLVSKSYICPCDVQCMLYHTLDFMLIIIQRGGDLATSLLLTMACSYSLFQLFHASMIVAPSNLSIIASIGMEIYNSPLRFTRDNTCKSLIRYGIFEIMVFLYHRWGNICWAKYSWFKHHQSFHRNTFALPWP